MGSSGGMSQSEIYAIQKKAREDAEKEQAQKNAAANQKAQELADAAGSENVGGTGSGEGALGTAKKKRGSTLTGEGKSTFSPADSKLGE